MPDQRRRRDREVGTQRRPKQNRFVVARRRECVVRADGGPRDGVDAGQVRAERAQVFKGCVWTGVRRDRVNIDCVVRGRCCEQGHVWRELERCDASGVDAGDGQEGCKGQGIRFRFRFRFRRLGWWSTSIWGVGR